MIGMVAGTVTGIALGAAFVVAVCIGLEDYAGVKFGKEPLLLIVVVGMPLGGFVGALVGRWAVSTGAERRGPGNPAERGAEPDRDSG